MLDQHELWSLVRGCFETDDGSLPDVEIAPLSPVAVANIYAMLRRRSKMASDSAEFWHRDEGKTFEVDSVSNAAALVAAGVAEPFHHCIEGIAFDGVELPTLGVFVFPDAIALDYRMGPQWGPGQVSGFFSLLKECVMLDPEAEIRMAQVEGPPEPDRFLEAWKRYQ